MIDRRLFLRTLSLAPLAALAGNRRSASAEAPLRITLAGQSLMTRPLCTQSYEGFDAVTAELARGDVVFTDLEVAIKTAESGQPTRDTQFLHYGSEDVLTCLAAMHFNLLALSNNHAWDLGTEGVLATRAAVSKHGFVAAGTGEDLAAASAPALIDVRGRIVALVAAATERIRDGAAATDSRAGVNELRLVDGQPETADAARITGAIREARARADFVIAYHHNHDWGDDMAVTRPWARRWADACVEAGADIYVSHGAPLLHGIALQGNSLQLFGLGSLIFHSITPLGHYPPEVWETAIVHCDYAGGALQSAEIVPVVLNERGDDPARQNETRGRPRIATGAAAARILNRLRKLSAALGSDIRLAGDRAYLEI